MQYITGTNEISHSLHEACTMLSLIFVCVRMGEVSSKTIHTPAGAGQKGGFIKPTGRTAV